MTLSVLDKHLNDRCCLQILLAFHKRLKRVLTSFFFQEKCSDDSDIFLWNFGICKFQNKTQFVRFAEGEYSEPLWSKIRVPITHTAVEVFVDLTPA